MKIKKVILCGLGAVGLTYANKLKNICELKILANEERIERYKKNPPMLNGEKIELEYISPDSMFSPEMIIITTKNDGLDSAIEYIKNFVGKDTIIISLLNGITSEEKIAEKYGWDKVLHSYFIGHSAMRVGNNVTQDGVGKIFFGSPYEENQEKVKTLKEFFEEGNIDYEIPEDIMYSLVLKYTFNTYANQLSAINNMTFGEMKGEKFETMARAVIREVKTVLEADGELKNLDNLEEDALNCLKIMTPEGKTSMLQDIEAGRKTEVDIFSGEIIKMGKKYGIPTPCNQMLYHMIKVKEQSAQIN